MPIRATQRQIARIVSVLKIAKNSLDVTALRRNFGSFGLAPHAWTHALDGWWGLRSLDRHGI
jgi:hypothetical protein